MRRIIAAFSILLTTCTITQAAAPATQPDAPAMTDVRIETLKPCTIAYTERQVARDQIKDALPDMMTELHKSLAAANVSPVGAPIIVMTGLSPDEHAQMTVDVASPVADNTPDTLDCQLRKLDAVTTAVVVVNGATAESIPSAYIKLYQDVMSKGYQPTGEARQQMLYWEGDNSPNNVVMIELVVQ